MFGGAPYNVHVYIYIYIYRYMRAYKYTYICAGLLLLIDCMVIRGMTGPEGLAWPGPVCEAWSVGKFRLQLRGSLGMEWAGNASADINLTRRIDPCVPEVLESLAPPWLLGGCGSPKPVCELFVDALRSYEI